MIKEIFGSERNKFVFLGIDTSPREVLSNDKMLHIVHKKSID